MASVLLRSYVLAQGITRQFVPRLLAAAWPASFAQRRNLNVHEHESFTLLREAGIPVPKFGVAYSKEDALMYAKEVKGGDIVLKAQVLAGGRGKGRFKNGLKGGVVVVKTPEEAAETAGKMLGQILVTKQTGEQGRICNAVMVTERKLAKQEYYIAIMLERAYNGPVIIASSQGGVDIEEVAAKNPDAIIYEAIDVMEGLLPEQAERIATKIGLGGKKKEIGILLMKLYALFLAKDALLVEINPFAEDKEGNFFGLDAKFKFDENAAFRQKRLFMLRDLSQEDPKEVEASSHDLNYITLDGDIGCMVNGAGLAMATMDIISLHGGTPANFLDVGGGATTAQVTQAFKLITSDPKVICVLVNIFGGIMRCDIIAEGIIAATKQLGLKMPVVVRLQGTKVVRAQSLLGSSGLKLLATDDLALAARLITKIASILRMTSGGVLKVDFQVPILPGIPKVPKSDK